MARSLNEDGKVGRPPCQHAAQVQHDYNVHVPTSRTRRMSPPVKQVVPVCPQKVTRESRQLTAATTAGNEQDQRSQEEGRSSHCNRIILQSEANVKQTYSIK